VARAYLGCMDKVEQHIMVLVLKELTGYTGSGATRKDLPIPIPSKPSRYVRISRM
jgi:hypothetical protein